MVSCMPLCDLCLLQGVVSHCMSSSAGTRCIFMTEVTPWCSLCGELWHCLMHSRVSEPLLALTRAVPSRKARCGHTDCVEEEQISPGSQPQGQETVPESSVSLSTGMVWLARLLFSVFLIYSASLAQTRLGQVHAHEDFLGGSGPAVIHQF